MAETETPPTATPTRRTRTPRPKPERKPTQRDPLMVAASDYAKAQRRKSDIAAMLARAKARVEELTESLKDSEEAVAAARATLDGTQE